MSVRKSKKRQGLRLEWLEERNAPSRGGSLTAALESLHHHKAGKEHAGRVHDVSQPKAVTATITAKVYGADDPANHDANDANKVKGKDDPASHDTTTANVNGKDDPAGHDAKDDKGGHGKDHPTGHK